MVQSVPLSSQDFLELRNILIVRCRLDRRDTSVRIRICLGVSIGACPQVQFNLFDFLFESRIVLGLSGRRAR